MAIEALDSVRVSSPEDVRRAATALRDIARDLARMRVRACHNIAGRQPTVDGAGRDLAEIFECPELTPWWRAAALHSPLPAACRYEAEPFWANEAGFRTVQPNSFLDAIDLSRFNDRALARAAIVVPVHLPFAHVGAVSFIPLALDKHDLAEDFERHGQTLGQYARTFIGSYVRVMCRSPQIPSGSILSKREVEVLSWAAIGKTDNEIGTIMERSRATIRFHIGNASNKLNCVNRSQTLFKATQLGYIA
jgi:LuxR family quorum-sensing system transcriptional regulator CciR